MYYPLRITGTQTVIRTVDGRCVRGDWGVFNPANTFKTLGPAIGAYCEDPTVFPTTWRWYYAGTKALTTKSATPYLYSGSFLYNQLLGGIGGNVYLQLAVHSGQLGWRVYWDLTAYKTYPSKVNRTLRVKAWFPINPGVPTPVGTYTYIDSTPTTSETYVKVDGPYSVALV